MQRWSASRTTKSRSSISSGRWPCSAASGDPAGGVSARSCSSTKRVRADFPAPGSPSRTRRRCAGSAIRPSAGSGLSCSQVRAICSACAASFSGSISLAAQPVARKGHGRAAAARLRRDEHVSQANGQVGVGGAGPRQGGEVDRRPFRLGALAVERQVDAGAGVVAAPALRAATIASICLWRCSTTDSAALCGSAAG